MKVPINFLEDSILFHDNMTYEDDGDNSHAFRKDLKPGDAKWSAENKTLVYICPCGCGAVGAVPVSTGTKQDRGWLWDGNIEKPTLTPSILKTFGCRWHGFLTDGEFVSC